MCQRKVNVLNEECQREWSILMALLNYYLMTKSLTTNTEFWIYRQSSAEASILTKQQLQLKVPWTNALILHSLSEPAVFSLFTLRRKAHTIFWTNLELITLPCGLKAESLARNRRLFLSKYKLGGSVNSDSSHAIPRLGAGKMGRVKAKLEHHLTWLVSKTDSFMVSK